MVNKSEKILDYGDSGILIRFSEDFSEENWRKTHLFSNELKKHKISGILSVIPTLSSVFIHFDLLTISRSTLKEKISHLLENEEYENKKLNGKLYPVPIVFGGEYGPDLNYIEEELNLSKSQLIKKFTSKPQKILCISRGPMMNSPINNKIKRRDSPRPSVPEGTLNVAYNQIGISWVKAPSGWRSIGRTPVSLFDHTQIIPSALKPGDYLQFFSIDEKEFELFKSYTIERLDVDA